MNNVSAYREGSGAGQGQWGWPNFGTISTTSIILCNTASALFGMPRAALLCVTIPLLAMNVVVAHDFWRTLFSVAAAVVQLFPCHPLVPIAIVIVGEMINIGCNVPPVINAVVNVWRKIYPERKSRWKDNPFLKDLRSSEKNDTTKLDVAYDYIGISAISTDEEVLRVWKEARDFVQGRLDRLRRGGFSTVEQMVEDMERRLFVAYTTIARSRGWPSDVPPKERVVGT